jgi:DNA mismatch repair protein MutS
MSIVEDYIKNFSLYYEKYGENTCLLYQSGSFLEVYSTYSPTEDPKLIKTKGPNIFSLSSLLNIICTRKDKSINEISLKNPYLLGFPIVSAPKFIKLLVDNNFTVLTITQITQPPKPERKLTAIYSPGTYIENIQNPESNFTLNIYIEEINKIICCGLSAIDLSSGKCIIFECHSKIEDNKLALDDAICFINNISPKEIIIYNTTSLTKDFLLPYMEIEKRYYHYYNTIDNKYTKLNYQNELLKNIFSKYSSLISPIETLELDKYIFATISLVGLLDFLVDHNNKLLIDLDRPQIYTTNKHLFLGNNAVYQLNVDNNNNNNNKGLINILNQSSTAMGKRFIKNRLVAPLINKDQLNDIYDKAEIFIKDNKWKKIEVFLNGIQDIERLKRRIGLKIINPCELYNFIKSCENIVDLITYLDRENINIYPTNKLIKKLNKLIKYCNKNYLMDKLKIYMLADISESLFNKGLYEDIDKLDSGLIDDQSIINIVQVAIEKIIGKIRIKKSEKSGYFIQLTKIKADTFKQKLEKMEYIEINNEKIYTKQIIFENSHKTVKVYLSFLKEKSAEINKSESELANLVKSKFIESTDYLYKKYSKLLSKLCEFIEQLDYYKTIAKTSCLYNYVRPIINEKEYSFVNCKQLRHPIVEKIIDYEYVPHDIHIGEELKGMLIYGVNSAGKSVLMKALGLSVIMAQSGFFVPATEYIFSPFTAIYTRITSNDNIYRGMSSFVSEILELNAIQKRADKRTLIIGDEACNTTESVSGTAIVSATLIKLSQVNASFIFATHLHEIIDLDIIKNIKTIKAFHLSVNYDNATNKLIYDRQLCEGNGDRIYGISVANFLIDNKDFIELANSIKNVILKQNNSIITDKKSKYNSGIYVYECQICGNVPNKKEVPLDTHHINFQKDCKDGFVIGKNHIPKNSKQNLIVLCKPCHNDVHSDKITLNKYIMTSEGRALC